MTNEQIQQGFGVFTGDHEKAFGAVRQITEKPATLTVYVENAGDFVIGAEAVIAVHMQKVIVNPAKLDHELRTAIANAHKAEDRRL